MLTKNTLLSLFTTLSFAVNAQWTDVSNGSITTNLNAVSIASSDTVFAVGLSGTVVKSTDAGGNWNAQTSGITKSLYDVDFANHLIGIAVGRDGSVIRTTNGGTTWSSVTSGTTAHIYSVQFLNSDTVFYAGASGKIAMSINSGASWSNVTSPTSDKINDIDFINNDIGYIVGDNNIVYHTNNGRASWTSQTHPFGNSNNLFRVQVLDNNKAIAVGGTNWIMRTTNGGSTWIDESKSTASYYKDLSFMNTSIGYVAGANGVILYSNNGGNTFTSQTTPTTNILFGIETSPCGLVIAVGASGTILKNEAPISTNLTLSGCDNLIFNGTTYTTSQDIIENLISGNGCDSTHTTSIVINNSSTPSTLNATIVEGETYSFGNLTLSIAGTYLDTLQNFTGCDSLVTLNLTVTNDSVIDGISSNLKEEISIYPNPATENITIKTKEAIDYIEIVDLAGSVVLSQKSDLKTTSQIDLNELNKGIYLIKVTFSNQKVSNNKLIKQ